MAWDANSVETLQAFAGCYPLPGDCWAILAVNHSPPKGPFESAAYPEGYSYTWAILAPGEAPALRGPRMAGLDSDDKHVRDQIKADPTRGKHRAHRHFPNWKDVVTIRGEDWPIAGEGQQLQAPSASPEEFWDLCMDCLSDTLAELGLEVPERSQLADTRLTKEAFGKKQKEIEAELRPGLAP